MNDLEKRAIIEQGRTLLGIELGSTRIKAVLIDEKHELLATGGFAWENRLENGVWTYSMDDVVGGLQACYAALAKDVFERYGTKLTTVGAMGVSAMMHGYLVFDQQDQLLVPFRTWRNTMTAEAAKELTELFDFNIPQRWSVAHLRQAMLRREPHVPEIRFMTTLAGYVHFLLTGQRVLGVGDASGMFPIDSATGDYDAALLKRFDEYCAGENLPWKLRDILPRALRAGEPAGTLTEAGARLLDPSGTLRAGIPLCPPEGDAGTGMTATNSVAPRTGNVSAGTSVFAMLVLENPLQRVHPEIDLVTTPSGRAVAMAHCNNCTSDLNAWVGLFGEFARRISAQLDTDALYGDLFRAALQADPDCGGLMSYNYYSGEHITGFEEGRPLFVRSPEAKMTLANFMRAQLYSSLSVLKLGLNILLKDEHVKIDRMYGHGGLFRTKGVGQRILAAAIDAPVSVMDSASEGGAWGIALLAAFMRLRAEGQTLEEYLNERVFAGLLGEEMKPEPADVADFDAYLRRYVSALPVERAAVESV